MSARKTNLVVGEYYHIYNRGNNKNNIFHEKQDYDYFINLFILMNSQSRSRSRYINNTKVKGDKVVSIGAYCLMPNHFHLLLKQEKDNGITKFMQKLSTAYVMYYNKKYKRTGSLFEGKFKSKNASEDIYLKYLFSYIHLNPLKLVDKEWKSKKLNKKDYEFLTKYKYSSFNEYVNGKFFFISKGSFPKYFPTKKVFINEIKSWLSLEK